MGLSIYIYIQRLYIGIYIIWDKEDYGFKWDFPYVYIYIILVYYIGILYGIEGIYMGRLS